MEDWLWFPDECEIAFTCEFIDGPRTDEDLCAVTNISFFDPDYGDFFFYGDDPYEWPPGDYIFKITGTIGDLSDVYDFVLKLEDPCVIAQFTWGTIPFTDAVYILESPEIMQAWVDDDLYSVDYGNNGECGTIIVDFYNYNTEDYFDDESWFFFDDN